MASRQRSRVPRKERGPNPLVDLGIFDIPNVDMDDLTENDSDVDESALESELEALLSGKAPSRPARPKAKVTPALDIEKMAAECLKDPDEEDDDDGDENLTDPDLLNELQCLAVENPPEEDEQTLEMPEKIVNESISKPVENIFLLEERLHLYRDALIAAEASNDNLKVRRYTRSVKTLEGLLKSAKSGKTINEEDIPPVVNIPKAKGPLDQNVPEPHSEAPNVVVPPPKATEKIIDFEHDSCDAEITIASQDNEYNMLIARRDQYKIAALQAKRAGDKTTALNYVKILKGFDGAIEAIKRGDPIDLSNIPPPPSYFCLATTTSNLPKKEHEESQTSALEAAALSAASEPEDSAQNMFAAPPPPVSILEALEQRLEKYTSTKAAAEAEGNSSKVRRLERIIKSYEKAIRDWKAGKNIDFEDLPVPPGFAPIPVPGLSHDFSPPVSTPENKASHKERAEDKAPEVKPTVLPKRPAPQVPPQASEPQIQKPKIQRTNTSTIDKQLEFLLERQKMFRQAALAAKKNGDIQQAKEYLRMSKGFDSMIQATKSGLRIDASSIPTPPQLESDFVVVDVAECVCIDADGNPDSNTAELIETLEKNLAEQIEVCTRNKEHFLRLGDVLSASKFEKLGLESRKDLSVIKHLKKTGGSAPKFHYEMRLFSMVQCHTDLSDNDLEVTVERGINLPGKADDVDSYVRIELPIPPDASQKAKTQTIKDTNNPIFQEQFKFEINRKSRAQLRYFKRQALKLEVYSKGGFLRNDVLLGTVTVKLVDLESKCTIHDCFDLMDGRKACGGKLEVKIRIRDPLLVKQVEEVKEKWLVIGS